jgi:hypothetical protein
MKAKAFALIAASLFTLSALAATGSKDAKTSPGNCCGQSCPHHQCSCCPGGSCSHK